MNSDAELYSLHSLGQQKWASEILASTRFDAGKSYSNILDIGCGTGEVTNILFDELNAVEKLIAVDKYETMVELARRKNPRKGIEYLVADVTHERDFKPEWHHRFDLITSFLVLHWVPDHYQVLNLMKTLLSSRGEILFVMGIKPATAFLKAIQVITKSPKWEPYLKNFVPSWRHQPGWEEHNAWRKPDPAEGYRKLVESFGFLVHYCYVDEFVYVFPDREYGKGMVQTLLPHIEVIPPSHLANFMDDVYDIYEQSSEKDQNGRCQWNAEFLVVRAQIQNKDEL